MQVARTWAPLALLGIAVLVAGTACGGSKHAAAQTYTVNVDGHNKAANEAFLAYFPNVVRVHPGDSVEFHMVGNGEPHTVTAGTLVDKVVTGFEELTPAQQQNPPKELVRADARIPQLLPQGPGDAIQSMANPCYIDSGTPPAKGACPKVSQPDFTGKQSLYNTGWFDSNQKFTIHLSSSIAPGTYHYMCALHRESMTGKIVVVPSSATVPTPATQAAAGQKQLAAIEAKLQPAVTAERQGKFPLPVPGPNHVLAGSGSQSAQEAEIDEFGPKTIKIPVGGSVTWWLLGPHSITFASSKTNDDIRTTARDGTVHLNAKAVVPAGGPGEPQPTSTGGPPNGPPKFKVVAQSTWNGSGHHSSGVFVSSFGPPLIEGYRLTFTKAGTYKYICTVHDGMKGTVVVG
jgi:plastocyanin